MACVQLGRVALAMKNNEAANPVGVGFLGSPAVVPGADFGPDPVQ
jgi:hypothetical protein